MCEERFLGGWVPKFHAEGIDTEGYGICEKCLEGLYESNVSEREREEENIGIFLDWVLESLKTLDKHELARHSIGSL